MFVLFVLPGNAVNMYLTPFQHHARRHDYKAYYLSLAFATSQLSIEYKVYSILLACYLVIRGQLVRSRHQAYALTLFRKGYVSWAINVDLIFVVPLYLSIR